MKCPLFKDVDLNKAEHIINSYKLKISDYKTNAVVMLRGEEYKNLLILMEGEISAEIHNINGKTLKIETIKFPDALATAILFAEDNTLPVTIIAHTDLKVISIPKKCIIALCQESKKFLSNLLSDGGNKIAFLAEKIRLFKFNSIKQKIAGYLLNLSNKHKTDKIKLFYTREQLANLFGVERPSLSRIFSELYDNGILKLKNRIIYILDKERLKSLLLEHS